MERAVRTAPNREETRAQMDAWLERVRTGLSRILCFLDREPTLARFCVVQSARGDGRMLAHREEILRLSPLAYEQITLRLLPVPRGSARASPDRPPASRPIAG